MIITTRNPSFSNKPATTLQSGDTAGLKLWVEHRQSINPSNLVWGRISDNGINFIVEGFRGEGEQNWVSIPCRRLLDAQLLLGAVMTKDVHNFYKEEQSYRV